MYVLMSSVVFGTKDNVLSIRIRPRVHGTVQVMTDVKAKYPGLVIIDYTLPSAVMDNAEFYCQHNVPFVMGTTGGDRAKLVRCFSPQIYSSLTPLQNRVNGWTAQISSM